MSLTDSVEAPLLNDVVEGAVDWRGMPVFRSASGGWRSAFFIIGVEVGERFAYYGIASNLISYLTGPLGQSTASAAANVNAWSGAVSLLPLLGAFVADSFLGRYRTIIFASVLYILGLGLLTLSALLPFENTVTHQSNDKEVREYRFQVVFFFFSLYLVAIAQGGHKPCVQAFGADQFDGHDPNECKAKSSFFNWWYFCICMGTVAALLVLNYIQDNLNWALGFGIPCIAMAVALGIFLLGTSTYRYTIKSEERSIFSRIFTKARDGMLCCNTDGEETNPALRLVPIWVTSLIYAIVFAQSSTFFTKQGVTMDRNIVSHFAIPAASLQSFISLSIVIFIPIYDRVFVPAARSITHNPSGISMLQRIGTGIVLSVISMITAALVEMKRLRTAKDHGLVDMLTETVPMSVLWLVPQYVLFGIGDVFTMVGLQEFFYSEVPSELRSVGLSLYLSIFGIGSLLSSLLVSVIEKATDRDGHYGWFADNLNRAHLDYFYWVLAALSAVGAAAFMYFSKSYIYKRSNV